MPFDKKRLKTKSYVKLFNHNKLIVQTLSMKFNVQEKNVFFITARVSAECPLMNYNKSLIKMLNVSLPFFLPINHSEAPFLSLKIVCLLVLMFFTLCCCIIAHNRCTGTRKRWRRSYDIGKSYGRMNLSFKPSALIKYCFQEQAIT